MKVIPKYLKGGNFDSFFTTYTQVKTDAPRQTSNSGKSSGASLSTEKGKLTEKDFFDMMKDIDGLPNEMNNIITNLMNTFLLSNLTGVDPGNLATTYLLNLYLIKITALNKKRYDDVLANASKNGSLAEPAISMDGKLIIQNTDGSIGTISLDTYNANRDKYSDRILTVSNLANMRKYDPQLANNLSIFDVIDNSMGYEAFQELLSKATLSIGTSELTRNGMFSVEGNASKGLELLMTLGKDDRLQAMGSVTAEGLYKYKVIDKTQLQQINSMLSYITSVLPDRAKTWAAFKMGTSDKNKATRDLVFLYLLSGNSQQHTIDVDYQGSIEKVTGNKSKGDTTTDDIVLNTATKWLRGLGVQNVFTINPGTNYATLVLANTLPLTDSNKKYLGANSVLQQATLGEYAGILDFNSASMGMLRIDPSDFGKVILTDGKISSIDFPINMQRYNETGKIVPDLSPQTSEAKQTADREIKQLGIDLSSISSISANYKAINDIYAKHGLEPAYNPDGTPANNWRRFGVINASASNATLGMGQLDDNELLQPILDDSIVDNLLLITQEENYDKKNIYEILGRYDHFYRGTVWVPVDVSYVAASANSGIKTDLLNDIIVREAQLNSSKMLTKEKK